MTQRPKLLDLFCGQGGASMGYHRAGFDVYGVDLADQPRYPFAFAKSDALQVLGLLLSGFAIPFARPDGSVERLSLSDFAAIHASPPCQKFTAAAQLNPNVQHLDLLTPTRSLLIASGLPFAIENVPGAPMSDFITLCGSHFELRASDVDGVTLQIRRHRQFESSLTLVGAGKCNHDRTIKNATVFGYGGAMTPAYRDRKRKKGYVPATSVCGELLGIDWMDKRGLSESIPPAYTEFIGRQLIGALSA